jgi:predicted MFS family arabinose efflux permease
VTSTLLDTVAPAGTVTEAFTVMVMAIVIGTALGNAAGGAIVDSASYDAAVLWAGAAAVAGAALTVARRRTLAA